MSSEWGYHGGGGSTNPVDNVLMGLMRLKTWAIRHDGWLHYSPGGMASGLWLRGEYGWYKDRNTPNTVIDILGNDIAGVGLQSYAKPVVARGGYAALGYKLSDSHWAANLPAWCKSFELTARYENFGNVQIANLVRPDYTEVFNTEVWTGGINYYLKGHNAKIQANYNVVVNPEVNTPNLIFHKVKNDNFVLNFQVAF